MKFKRAVLFDVDGVLVDVHDLLRPFYEACDEMGLPRISEDSFYGRLVGHRPVEKIQELLQIDQKTAEKLYHKFREKYKSRASGIRVLPHAREVVRLLHEKGLGVGIVTTKSRDTALSVLDSQGFWYDVLVSASDVSSIKPSPEPLLKAAESLGVRSEDCIMVGDHPYDMLAAKRAGMIPVGVLTGVGRREDLEKAGAKIIIPNLSQLPKILEELGWTTRTK